MALNVEDRTLCTPFVCNCFARVVRPVEGSVVVIASIFSGYVGIGDVVSGPPPKAANILPHQRNPSRPGGPTGFGPAPAWLVDSLRWPQYNGTGRIGLYLRQLRYPKGVGNAS